MIDYCLKFGLKVALICVHWHFVYLWSRWRCDTRMGMMRLRPLPAAAKTGAGRASAALTTGAGWRGDAAGDTRCRTAEATPPPRHHPAAPTHTQAASCLLVASVSKTSAKGNVNEQKQGKKRNLIPASILAFALHDPRFQGPSIRVCFWLNIFWTTNESCSQNGIANDSWVHAAGLRFTPNDSTASLVLGCRLGEICRLGSRAREFNYTVIKVRQERGCC